MSGTVGVLLLAAGSGRRFGSDKRLATLPCGERLLDRSVAIISATPLPLRVALGPRDDAWDEELTARGITTLRCAAAEQGMGATLANAIRQLPSWNAVLVALADMPWLAPASIAAVAGAATAASICVPCYRGQRGHPVAFGADFWAELKALDGDRGARELLVRHAASVTEIVLEDPAILRDVDRPTDLTAPAAPPGARRPHAGP